MNHFSRKIRREQQAFLDRIVRRFPPLGLEKRAEDFVRLFEPYLPFQSRVLDIGGRWGFYREPLGLRNHHLTVLDVVKPGFQKAPVVLYQPEASFPFEDKVFDASLLVTVLHHIPDPVRILGEARRVTKKVVIVVEDLYHHALGRWWTCLRDQLYNLEFVGHPRQFKKKEEWMRLFAEEGFTVHHEEEVYTWLAGLRILNGVFILGVEGR